MFIKNIRLFLVMSLSDFDYIGVPYAITICQFWVKQFRVAAGVSDWLLVTGGI